MCARLECEQYWGITFMVTGVYLIAAREEQEQSSETV